MDVAYDHIQEETLAPEAGVAPVEHDKGSGNQPKGLNTEINEAYKVISSSPWGARLGGFFGTVKKQVRVQH